MKSTPPTAAIVRLPSGDCRNCQAIRPSLPSQVEHGSIADICLLEDLCPHRVKSLLSFASCRYRVHAGEVFVRCKATNTSSALQRRRARHRLQGQWSSLSASCASSGCRVRTRSLSLSEYLPSVRREAAITLTKTLASANQFVVPQTTIC
jgi:hypothetical protein